MSPVVCCAVAPHGNSSTATASISHHNDNDSLAFSLILLDFNWLSFYRFPYAPEVHLPGLISVFRPDILAADLAVTPEAMEW
jgi:hypothetical protein